MIRKEIYAIVAVLLFSSGILLAALQPRTVIGQQYAVGGEIVAEAPSEPFLTSQTVMAIMAIVAAAAAAGILVYNKRKV